MSDNVKKLFSSDLLAQKLEDRIINVIQETINEHPNQFSTATIVGVLFVIKLKLLMK